MFRELLLGLYTVQGLADRLRISSRTVRRWYAKNKAPHTVIELLQCLHGDLSKIHPDWHGWSIGRDGLLYTPDGKPFDPGHIQAIIYQRQLVRHLSQQVKQLNREKKEFKFMTQAANEYRY